MALIYRSVFRTGREDGRAHLEATFRGWLEHKRLAPDLPVSGARALSGGGRFNDAVGAGYRLRRGAWRTYQPGMGQEGDDPRRHRALSPERILLNPHSAIRMVAGSFRSGALAKSLPALYRDQLADVPGFRSAERITLREAPPEPTDVEGRLTVAAQTERDLVALVEETERNLSDERSARADLERERDDALLEGALLADELSTARGRIAFLGQELLRVDVRAWDLETPAALPVPGSFEELLEAATEQLPQLVLGEATKASLELDENARSSTWVVKAWDALLALQSFAEARLAGDFEGNVEQWCRDCPPGARIVSASALSMTEHETVQNHKAMREARTFAVPKTVHPDGRVAMWAHYKIDVRDPAPRLHFHDDTRGTGKVYVGYLGRHLLSPKTT